MCRRRLWRSLAAFLALNAAFAALGLLWRHPAVVTGWWVGWILADVALLGAIAMTGLDWPLRLTWNRVFAWVFICVNLGALVYLVDVAIAASRCDSGGAPDACNIGILYVLDLPAWSSPI